jgi:hypothetical protein
MIGFTYTFSKLLVHFVPLNFDAFQIRVVWREVKIMMSLLKLKW